MSDNARIEWRAGYEQGVKDGRAQVLAEVQEAIAGERLQGWQTVGFVKKDLIFRADIAERVREIGMSE